MLRLTHLFLLIQQIFFGWIRYARTLFRNHGLKDIFFSLFHQADAPRWKVDNKKDTRIIFKIATHYMYPKYNGIEDAGNICNSEQHGKNCVAYTCQESL